MTGDDITAEVDAPSHGGAGPVRSAPREAVGGARNDGSAALFDFEPAKPWFGFDLAEPLPGAGVAAAPVDIAADPAIAQRTVEVVDAGVPLALVDKPPADLQVPETVSADTQAIPLVDAGASTATPADGAAMVAPAENVNIENEAAHQAETPADPVRQRLVRQFETWLDRMSEGEPPPEGLPEELLVDAGEAPEPDDGLSADLYTLFAGLTKLSGEIGLQGRAFKQLTDLLGPLSQAPGKLDRIESAQVAVARELAQRIQAVQESVARELARFREPDEKSDLPDAKDVLAVLFDLYDRLKRGLQTLDTAVETPVDTDGSDASPKTAPDGLLQRLFGAFNGHRAGDKATVERPIASAGAMKDGYRLTLSRLEAAMRQWGIKRIGEVGEAFDPLRMAVIDVETAPGVPDGSVLEVYRSGYLLHGRVLETARVKVSKSK